MNWLALHVGTLVYAVVVVGAFLPRRIRNPPIARAAFAYLIVSAGYWITEAFT